MAKLAGGRQARPGQAQGLMQQLADLLLPRVGDMQAARGVITALFACAKARWWPAGELLPRLLQRLEADGCALMTGEPFNGQDCGNLFWSVLQAAKCAGASTAAAAFMQQATRPGGVLAAAAGVLKDPVRRAGLELTPQNVSNMLLACAGVPYAHDTALLDVLLITFNQLPSPNHQELSNVLYSLALLHSRHPHSPDRAQLTALCSTITAYLQRQADGFKPQAMSNIAYALGLLATPAPGSGYSFAPPPQLLAALGNAFSDRLNSISGRDYFNAQDMSNSLYAAALLAEAGVQQQRELGALGAQLAHECVRRGMGGFKPQAISNSTWAAAKLGLSDPAFYSTACRAVRAGGMAGATAQGWSNLCWALAQARHLDTGVLDVAADALLAGLLQRANAQECANVLWACATLGHCPRQQQGLVGAVLARLLAQLPQASVQDACNSLWALVALDQLQQHAGQAQQLLQHAMQVSRPDFAPEDLCQLWQVHVEAQRLGLPQLQLPQGPLLQAAGDAMRQVQEQVQQQAMSGTQAQVVQALQQLAATRDDGAGSSTLRAAGIQSMQVLASEQLLTAEAAASGACRPTAPCSRTPGSQWLMLVDCVVQLQLGDGRSVVVAVELDGPTHFMTHQPHTQRHGGSTQLRNRWLGHAFGPACVVLVPYWEWGRLRGSPQQLEHLAVLLAGCAAKGRAALA